MDNCIVLRCFLTLCSLGSRILSKSFLTGRPAFIAVAGSAYICAVEQASAQTKSEAWTPRYFERVADEKFEYRWKFNGKYWEERDERAKKLAAITEKAEKAFVATAAAEEESKENGDHSN